MISPDAMIAAAGDPLVSSLVMDDQNIIQGPPNQEF